MHMEMHYGLASSLTDVDPHVEPVREARLQNLITSNVDRLCQSALFGGTCLEPTGDMAPRHQQRMPG